MNILHVDESRREAKAYIPMINNDEFKDSNALRIDVEYSAGGMNYFSGNNNPRGYRVSVKPVARTDHGESYTLMGDKRKTGGYIMIEQANRYNKRRLLELAEKIDSCILAIADAYIKNDTGALIEMIKNKEAKAVEQQAVKPPEALKMKPLTQEVLKAFAKQGNCGDKEAKDVKIIAKFFTPDAQCSWYATEYNPETRIFFGFANLGDDQCAELGDFSLTELEGLRGKLGLPVEMDRHFGEHTLQEVMDFKVR